MELNFFECRRRPFEVTADIFSYFVPPQVMSSVIRHIVVELAFTFGLIGAMAFGSNRTFQQSAKSTDFPRRDTFHNIFEKSAFGFPPRFPQSTGFSPRMSGGFRARSATPPPRKPSSGPSFARQRAGAQFVPPQPRAGRSRTRENVPPPRGARAQSAPPASTAAHDASGIAFLNQKLATKVNGSSNHFAVLGVPDGAPKEEITKAYKKLRLEVHPDKNPAAREAATEAFKIVDNAYKKLNA